MLQEQEKICIPKLGSLSPDFTADTTQGEIKLSDYKGRWIVIFSYPGDFMPVKSMS
jgi:alkyl hydroperoxide reductase subunit AhpC